MINRREFLRLNGGALALTSLNLYCPYLHSHPLETMAGPKEITAPEFHATRRFVGTQQGRIAYVERGKGPAALFLHGFPLNGFQWRGIIPELAKMRRCLAPDLLALGYTEVAAGQSLAAKAQVAMLAQFLDKLSIASVDIIANDSGGAIAQLFVTTHPERARSLLLTNCDTEPDSPPPAVMPVITLARAGKFADEWLVPWLADKRLARSQKGLGGQCYSNPSHPPDEAIETYLGPLVSSPQRKALTNAYAMALDPNPLAGIEAGLKHCHVPTRIVWGTSDEIFSQAGADYLDHTFVNSFGVRRVAGAKLFFPEEMPELIVEEASRLWSA